MTASSASQGNPVTDPNSSPLSPPSGRLAGKVALITGAARGQGRSHALAMAAEGCDIIGIDICHNIPSVPYEMGTHAELEHTRAEVEKLGRTCHIATADVRDVTAMDEAVTAGVQQLGRLDFVIANAGVAPEIKSTWDRTEEEWDAVVDTNVKGTWVTAKVALPHVIAAGNGGCFLAISSMVGLRGAPFSSSYTTSKWAVNGLAKSLSNELGFMDIRANSIHPGNVRTPMIDNEMMRTMLSGGKENATLEDTSEAYSSMNSMNKPWVEPEDISAMVIYLCSDAGRYITGTSLSVDLGGAQKFGI